MSDPTLRLESLTLDAPLALSSGGLGNVGFGGQTSPAYPVDVTGQVNASTGYRVGGVAGVSCSGVPTASFVVTNGLVTHC